MHVMFVWQATCRSASYLTCAHTCPLQLERGRVVNTASILGRYAYAAAVPYTISKFGVEAYTDSLRQDEGAERNLLVYVDCILRKAEFYETEDLHVGYILYL